MQRTKLYLGKTITDDIPLDNFSLELYNFKNTLIYGEEETGKTFSALRIAKECFSKCRNLPIKILRSNNPVWNMFENNQEIFVNIYLSPTKKISYIEWTEKIHSLITENREEQFILNSSLIDVLNENNLINKGKVINSLEKLALITFNDVYENIKKKSLYTTKNKALYKSILDKTEFIYLKKENFINNKNFKTTKDFIANKNIVFNIDTQNSLIHKLLSFYFLHLYKDSTGIFIIDDLYLQSDYDFKEMNDLFKENKKINLIVSMTKNKKTEKNKIKESFETILENNFSDQGKFKINIKNKEIIQFEKIRKI